MRIELLTEWKGYKKGDTLDIGDEIALELISSEMAINTAIRHVDEYNVSKIVKEGFLEGLYRDREMLDWKIETLERELEIEPVSSPKGKFTKRIVNKEVN
jgi:hypothetical protein